jgi:hypothetical protein
MALAEALTAGKLIGIATVKPSRARRHSEGSRRREFLVG